MAQFLSYFSHPFVWYALIVGVLISLCAALLGVTLTLKRMSFIGDGLSHVAFGALAVATVLGFAESNLLIVLGITVVCAIVLLRTGQNTLIKGDAAIGMLSVGALALGYMLLNIFPTANTLSDVCTSLFGSHLLLTLGMSDVWLCIGLALAVIAVFIIFFNRIFAVTFDEAFARASGVRVGAYNMIIAVTVAVVIVLAMKLVGSLLISALVIFPALSAMRVFKSFRSVVIASGAISVVCALVGMLASIALSTPVGATVVMVNAAAFAVFCIIGKVKK